MQIGPYVLPNRLFVAPMAGVTGRPFRQMCRRLGAGYAVGEMVASRPELRSSPKTSQRVDHRGEAAPIAVQIVGTDAAEMTAAAQYHIDHGAQIIDINMGCPAKKVCSKWAGAALMRDEPLALAIVEAVVRACAPRGVPVTLKIRTGWSAAERNAVRIARAAESAGISLLAVHGRTREQGYGGCAEYDTIAAVKAVVRIPVVANGDIDSPAKAAQVLRATGADALMIGRAALGRPWIFGEIADYLRHGCMRPPPATHDVRGWLLDHLRDHHRFYGETAGVRSARKHIGWTVQGLPGADALRQRINRIDSATAQSAALAQWLDALAEAHPRWPAAPPCTEAVNDNRARLCA